MSYKKAGIVIVGDEILKGQVTDTNSGYMCKRLHAIGVKVCRITTVADNVEDIAEEVAALSKKYNIVITSGGVGPTHDDMTYEGVAKALDDKIVLHPEMAQVIEKYFRVSGEAQGNPALKMALIPENSKLIYVSTEKDCCKKNGLQEKKKTFPVVQVKNVFVLPGMSKWCEHAFDHLQKSFQNTEVNFYTIKLFVSTSELRIIEELNNAVLKFEKTVTFGSYPFLKSDGNYNTKITIESTSLDEVTSAHTYLKSVLPKEYINSGLQAEDMENVFELTNGGISLSNSVADSLKIIEQAYNEYKINEIYLSFNGGKDCTVLMHLVWAYVCKLSGCKEKINTIYVRSDDPFPELDEFILRSAERYNLNLITVSGDIKSELDNIVKNTTNVKAIFMGTRRTDPYSEQLKSFQMCDPGWPQIMRINPLLDWSYHDVWDFLRLLAVPYCSLYDEGYTSLGSVKNTLRNPALEISSPSGEKNYDPAFKLKDGALERQGRT